MPGNILITGRPGSGKTTCIRKLAANLGQYRPVGFYTEEMRSHGIRSGFRIATLDNARSGILARINAEGPHRIGKYSVDLVAFDRFLDFLPVSDPVPRLVMIDEIGKMECLSEKFEILMTSLLDGPAVVIATVGLKGGGFIDIAKRRADVKVYELTEKNRNTLVEDIARLVVRSV